MPRLTVGQIDQAKAGDRLEAAQEYLRILQIVPDQPEARRELVRLGRPSQ